MIDTPEIAQTAAQRTAFIRLTIPRAEIQKVMGPGIGELMSTVAAQGVAPAGPWFNHHLRMEPDTFDFEISVPVAKPVVAAGRVQPGEVPAMAVVRAIHRGPYESLPDAWREFDAWIKTSGHATGPELWERYVAGPESSDDPAQWRTELSRRLVARAETPG